MHEDIAREIEQMAVEDQKMRDRAMQDPSQWDLDLDKRHTTRMKEIIREIGWPTISKVGKKASDDAWLLVQHADHDVQFQSECLELMKAIKEEIKEKNIAYLEDRVRINEGRPQLYGTQFFTDKDGTFQPRPIENPEELDERRQTVGLEPFNVYQESVTELRNRSMGKKL